MSGLLIRRSGARNFDMDVITRSGPRNTSTCLIPGFNEVKLAETIQLEGNLLLLLPAPFCDIKASFYSPGVRGTSACLGAR
jgi:hypothetical protein